MTVDTSREAVEAAADRLERALDPDKRGGWSRLMSRGEEGDEIADFRTVIAGARARDKFAANLDAVKAAARVLYPGPNDTDASLMAGAASKLERGYEVGGSNVTAAVARVLRAVAAILADTDEGQSNGD